MQISGLPTVPLVVANARDDYSEKLPLGGAVQLPVASEVPADMTAAVALTRPAAVDLPVAVAVEVLVVEDVPAALVHTALRLCAFQRLWRSLT